MSFTYDTTNPEIRDKLRLQIGDTDASSYIFEDEELDIFLNVNNNQLMLAVAAAARAVAFNKAKMALAWQVHRDLKIDKKDLYKAYLEIARSAEERYMQVGDQTDTDLVSFFSYEISRWGEDQSQYIESD
jgi:hypothetical protein